jgi:hypothetical protein
MLPAASHPQARWSKLFPRTALVATFPRPHDQSAPCCWFGSIPAAIQACLPFVLTPLQSSLSRLQNTAEIHLHPYEKRRLLESYSPFDDYLELGVCPDFTAPTAYCSLVCARSTCVDVGADIIVFLHPTLHLSRLCPQSFSSGTASCSRRPSPWHPSLCWCVCVVCRVAGGVYLVQSLFNATLNGMAVRAF